MPQQHTIGEELSFEGIDPFSGMTNKVELYPALPNTGIVFETPNGYVRACLDNAYALHSSIVLQGKGGNARVINVEHPLATFLAYGVDNVRAKITRVPSRSFRMLERVGLATDIMVMPVPHDREVTLCNLLDSVEIVPQDALRKTCRVREDIITPKLSFMPSNEEGLRIKVTTVYPTPGKEEFEAEINPTSYRYELAASRPLINVFPAGVPYAIANWVTSRVPLRSLSPIASVFHPSFGIGHGITEETFFLHTTNLKQWRSQEIYPAEIARHSIIDRLGAIALLDGRLEGTRVETKFSNHANDLAVLKKYVAPNLRYK